MKPTQKTAPARLPSGRVSVTGPAGPTTEQRAGEGADAQPAAKPAGPVHVTCTADKHTANARYRDGCTCSASLLDKRRSVIERELGRPRTVDATGTRRRIRALMANGWTGRHIMAELGWAGSNLGPQVYQQARVYRSTADRVAAIYDRLADTPGPSDVTRRRAVLAGWLGPFWWDADTIDDPDYQPATHETARPHKYDIDEVNVRRALAGQTADLTRAERLEAVRQLRGRFGYDAIATRLGVSPRQVHRDLAELGLIGYDTTEATA